MEALEYGQATATRIFFDMIILLEEYDDIKKAAGAGSFSFEYSFEKLNHCSQRNSCRLPGGAHHAHHNHCLGEVSVWFHR
jgi:hypothetical protein